MFDRPTRALLLAAALSTAVAPLARAQTAAPAADDGAGDAIRFLVERQVAGAVPGGPHRVEVQVGRIDPRLQLAPCGRIEPYLPPGARLWGRTTIGVRCVEGARWATLLPVTVSVFGPALVAAVPLAAGAAVTPADVRLEEVDLTRESAPPVADPSHLAGRVLTRAIVAGQPIRQDWLRLPPVVSAGDPIRIRLVGQGFTVISEGVAMAPAAEGQTLRVRTESGRVVVGQVRDRAVELKL